MACEAVRKRIFFTLVGAILGGALGRGSGKDRLQLERDKIQDVLVALG
jgi:hypothetical protein